MLERVHDVVASLWLWISEWEVVCFRGSVWGAFSSLGFGGFLHTSP
jgi:hypothetical protein